MGLKRLGCREAHGWIWAAADGDAAPDIDDFLDGLAADFAWLDAGNLAIVHEDVVERAVNWKVLCEGGLESYHFRVAHRDTIGPFFQDNLSSYQTFGRHIRSILPRAPRCRDGAGGTEPVAAPCGQPRLFDFPSAQLLVQEDHIVWIRILSLAADRSRLRLATLAPADADLADPETARHWCKNQDITMRTLAEDFEIGENIQSGLLCGANVALHFGRFEGALDRLDGFVEAESEKPARSAPPGRRWSRAAATAAR